MKNFWEYNTVAEAKERVKEFSKIYNLSDVEEVKLFEALLSVTEPLTIYLIDYFERFPHNENLISKLKEAEAKENIYGFI